MVDNGSLKGALFLANLILVGGALGFVAAAMPRALPLPIASRVLFGFSLTPFVLGLWMQALSIILPGWNPVIGSAVPFACAVAVFIVSYRDVEIFDRLISKGLQWWDWLALAMLAVLSFAISIPLYRNAMQPIIAHDAGLYLGNVRYFLEKRTIEGIVGFRDPIEGVVRGGPHGFTWQAYVSYARDFLGMTPKLEDDSAVTVAFQATVPWMLASVFAFAYAVRGSVTVASLSIFLTLFIYRFEYISFASSRDGFRIIPLLLLSALLLQTRLSWQSWITIAIASGLSLTAHTLGGIIAGTLVIARAVSDLISLRRDRSLATLGSTTAIGSAVGVGLSVSAVGYFCSYIETGTLWGLTATRYALAGTILEADLLRHYVTGASTAGMGSVELFVAVLKRDSAVVIVLGLLSALAILAVAVFKTVDTKVILSAAFAVALGLPLIGAFDAGPYVLSEWFVQNARYTLHWYPFLAVTISITTMSMLNYVSMRRPHILKGAAVSTALILAFLPAIMNVSQWRKAGPQARRNLEARLEPFLTAQESLPSESVILTDEESLSGYLTKWPLLLYAEPNWSILKASTEKQAAEIIQSKNIGALILMKRQKAFRLERLPFWSAATSHEAPNATIRDRTYDTILLRPKNPP